MRFFRGIGYALLFMAVFWAVAAYLFGPILFGVE